jgi:hypothetical protein
MNDPYPVSRKLLPLSSTTTDISAVPPPQGTAKKLRCRFGTPGTSALQDASQVVPLLRYRLRVVTFITTVFFSLFLALSFLKQSEPDGPTNGDLAIHSLVVAVMLLVCCALWTTYPLSILVLRVMELAVFGAAAAYFVYGYLIISPAAR